MTELPGSRDSVVGSDTERSMDETFNSIVGEINQIASTNDGLFEKLIQLRSRDIGLFTSFGRAFIDCAFGHAEVWRILSMHYIRAGDLYAARICNDRQRAASPTSEDAAARAVRLALLAGQLDEAASLVQSPLLLGTPAFFKMHEARAAVVAEVSEESCVRLGVELLALAREEFAAAAAVAEQPPVSDPELLQRQATNREFFRRIVGLIEDADTIALLGNGSVLMGSGLGKVIDDHDLVIRINWPTVAGFEQDVGGKTSIVFFVEQYMHGSVNQKSLLGKMMPYDGIPGVAMDAARTVFTSFPEMDNGIPSNLCLMPAPVRRLLKAYGYQHATTGLSSMNLLALFLGKKIDIYGFDFYHDLNRQYYFGTNPPDPHLTHELLFESWTVNRFFKKTFPGCLV